MRSSLGIDLDKIPSAAGLGCFCCDDAICVYRTRTVPDVLRTVVLGEDWIIDRRIRRT